MIAAKFGFNVDQDTGVRGAGVNSRPARIRRVAESALKHLHTDRIDLFYQHRVDPDVPVEEVAGCVPDPIAEGKVLRFGLSEAGLDTIRRAHAVQPIVVVQSEYSLFWRGPELDLQPQIEEPGVRFVPFSPLGAGYLTSQIDETTTFDPTDFCNLVPRLAPEPRKANWARVAVICDLAADKGATPAQVALAWLLAQRPWIAPIPFTTKRHRLRENLGVSDVALLPADLARVDAALAAPVCRRRC